MSENTQVPSRALISCCAVALAQRLAWNCGFAQQAPEVARVFLAGGEKKS